MRQNSDALEPDGERPEDLPKGVFVREEDGEDGGATEEVLYAEGVEVGVVRGLVFCCHEVNYVPRGPDEEDLEDGVVGGGGEGPEEVWRGS